MIKRGAAAISLMAAQILACGGPSVSQRPTAPNGPSTRPPEARPTASLVPEARSDGATLPRCSAELRAEPWPTAGTPPPSGGVFADWIGNDYVHLVDDSETATWRAHIFSPKTRLWRTAEFVTVDEPLRSRLDSDDLPRFHASVAPIFVSATSSRLVVAPLDAGARAHGGATLDPVTATWQALPPEQAVWRRASYRMWSSGRYILFWPFSSPPYTRAASELYLLEPTTSRFIEIPLPPIDLSRQSTLVALDDHHIVAYGGEQRDQYNNPARTLGDGAIFDVKTRRWTAMPGSPGRIASPALFHNGVLLLFGGIDYTLSKVVDYVGDALTVRDIRALEVDNNRWLVPESSWSSWQRWQPGFAGCTGCGPTVAVGSRIFVGRRAVFDTENMTLEVIPPWTAPTSWSLPGGPGQENLRGVAIDDRHVLLTSTAAGQAAAEAVVFDAVSRRACVLAIPPAATPLLVGTHQSFHKGALYLWREGRTVSEEEERNCPEGAPCMAPRSIERYLGPESLVLRLERRP